MTEHQSTPKAPPETPIWCGYPEPWKPVWGCWSLLSGRIKGATDCRDCECCKMEIASG